jgi:Nucleotidyltransferase domain.
MEMNHYFNDWKKYVKDICDAVKEKLPDAKIIVFGSILKGNYVSSLSDIDVLIVSDRVGDVIWRANMDKYIRERVFGNKIHPFEFHYSTYKEYEEWYKDFIDKKIEMC